MYAIGHHVAHHHHIRPVDKGYYVVGSGDHIHRFDGLQLACILGEKGGDLDGNG